MIEDIKEVFFKNGIEETTVVFLDLKQTDNIIGEFYNSLTEDDYKKYKSEIVKVILSNDISSYKDINIKTNYLISNLSNNNWKDIFSSGPKNKFLEKFKPNLLLYLNENKNSDLFLLYVEHYVKNKKELDQLVRKLDIPLKDVNPLKFLNGLISFDIEDKYDVIKDYNIDIFQSSETIDQLFKKQVIDNRFKFKEILMPILPYNKNYLLHLNDKEVDLFLNLMEKLPKEKLEHTLNNCFKISQRLNRMSLKNNKDLFNYLNIIPNTFFSKKIDNNILLLKIIDDNLQNKFDLFNVNNKVKEKTWNEYLINNYKLYDWPTNLLPSLEKLTLEKKHINNNLKNNNRTYKI